MDEDIIDSKLCVCVHPSPLPKYRGGCPVQHQIINGETESAVSIFIMDDKLDHGPILWSKKFSLEGELRDVFNAIGRSSVEGLEEILRRGHRFQPSLFLDWGVEQEHEEATTFKRRKPSESEINLEDFGNYTAEELYNKIRALQDPYPNPYVVCKDGTKLYLIKAKHEQK